MLHAFQGIFNNSDGSFPHAGLTLNPNDGMPYGTTVNRGNSSDNGTVFSIDPSTGKEKVVHAFSGSDGAHPYGDLYIKKGAIYGTTGAGRQQSWRRVQAEDLRRITHLRHARRGSVLQTSLRRKTADGQLADL